MIAGLSGTRHRVEEAQFAALERRRHVHLSHPIRFRTKRNHWRSFVITLTDLRESPAVRGVVVNARDITKELKMCCWPKSAAQLRTKLVDATGRNIRDGRGRGGGPSL